MKKLINVLLISTGIAMVANAVPTMTDVRVRQRFPWNGLVDIEFTTTGVEGPCSLSITATDLDGGRQYAVRSLALDGVQPETYPITTDKSYRFVWDASKDIGAFRVNRLKMEISLVDLDLGGEPVQLWEDGPYFSKHNIGATNPEDSGLYFWWGDTIGHKCTSGSFSFSFEESNTPTHWKTTTELQNEGWIDNNLNLVPKHDAAHIQWGRNWRMPKGSEFQKLIDNCTWTYMTINGIAGYIISGKGDYSTANIFLPHAGVGGNSSSSEGKTRYNYGRSGYYWSSTAITGYPPRYSEYLIFGSGLISGYNGVYDCHYNNRKRMNGYPIRPVKDFANQSSSVSNIIKASAECTFDGHVATGDNITLTKDEMSDMVIEYDRFWGDTQGDTVSITANGVPFDISDAAGSIKLGMSSDVIHLVHEVFKDGISIGSMRKTLVNPTVLINPTINVESANIPYDTLTLSWSCAGSDDDIKFSLYRNTTDNFASAICIAEGDAFNTKLKLLGNTYTENDFMKITPQTSVLHYWIVANNATTGVTETGHVEARRRHLLSIGYSSYAHADTPMIQKYRNANLFRNRCRSYGDFSNSLFISDIDATTEKVRGAMRNFAQQVCPGDLFVLYIDTHGGDYGVEDDASLSTYDDAYLSADLQDDVRLFPAGVAFVGIISACHSKALIGGVNQRNEINEWLAKWGFAQCLGNVAWIASCDAMQSSYTYSPTGTYTEFGYSFIYDGLSRGCADRTLSGTEYKGGNEDGFITFGELARYANEFSQGMSDAQPSVVQIENESLLDRIVATRRTSYSSYVVPNAPTNVVATKGEFESKIKISWNSASGASHYKVYRISEDNLNEKVWVGHSRSALSVTDQDCELSTHYRYLIQSVGPTGKSELSESDANSVGWRGSDRLLQFMDNYRPSNMEAASYAAVESVVGENGYSLGASYIAGLDPTNETSKFTANITVSNGVPSIVWTPDLGSNRTYTIYGKTDLTDANWTSPTNSSHRFFKVGVELPE